MGQSDRHGARSYELRARQISQPGTQTSLLYLVSVLQTLLNCIRGRNRRIGMTLAKPLQRSLTSLNLIGSRRVIFVRMMASASSTGASRLHDEEPAFIYGTAWKKDQTKRLVKEALKAGFRRVDTAAQPRHYQERLVGEALREGYSEGAVRREDILGCCKAVATPIG